MNRNRQPVNRHPAPSPVCRAQLERRWEALGMPQRGIDLTAAQFEALAGYVALLQQWQRHLNLTGLRDI